METTTRIRGEKKKRVKLMLLAGQKLSKKYLDQTLDVTNSAEIVRQLRKEMEIITEWRVSENGIRYGIYHHPKQPKVSRIATREYLQQA